MNVYTKEEILNLGEECYGLTVAELLNFIQENNIPPDAPVLIQRVEDKYYEGFDVSGMRGPGGIIPEGTKSNGWKVYPKEQGTGPTQYSPAWSCVYYREDKEILFIDLHY
jgi:hypothetical protein